jgi:hypothetical protein
MKNKSKQKSLLFIAAFVLLFVTLTGFSVYRGINISVRFVNISECGDSLKLEFKTTYPETKIKSSSGGTIDIFKNDSLYVRLATDSAKYVVDFWIFPSIPNGYRILYPEFTDTILPFKKTNRLKFVFSSSHIYYGTWEYKPFYSNEKARWLFDEFGNQKIIISSKYEPWLFGKDIIIVEINEKFSSENAKFQLFDNENNPLEFELKYKKTTTNIVALKLNKKEKKGRELRLSLDFGEGKYYEEKITVPDKSTVGIAGKYNRL